MSIEQKFKIGDMVVPNPEMWIKNGHDRDRMYTHYIQHWNKDFKIGQPFYVINIFGNSIEYSHEPNGYVGPICEFNLVERFIPTFEIGSKWKMKDAETVVELIKINSDQSLVFAVIDGIHEQSKGDIRIYYGSEEFYRDHVPYVVTKKYCVYVAIAQRISDKSVFHVSSTSEAYVTNFYDKDDGFKILKIEKIEIEYDED